MCLKVQESLMWGGRSQNDIKLFTSKKKSKWFSESFSLRNGRLIKYGRNASQTLRFRYRPNNVQRAPWCTISLGRSLSHSFCLPFHFQLPTTLLTSVSFPLHASFLRSDFLPPSKLGKEEKEWERQKDREKFLRKKLGKRQRESIWDAREREWWWRDES